ncbi:MAG: hypothetical protein IJX41_07085, partial [Bacteroidaceae bacterium]|nr:hypothetical protein [Bacteroidaceae bacterium]
SLRVENMSNTFSSNRPLISNASIVLAKVGASLFSTIFSISARFSAIPTLNASLYYSTEYR